MLPFKVKLVSFLSGHKWVRTADQQKQQGGVWTELHSLIFASVQCFVTYLVNQQSNKLPHCQGQEHDHLLDTNYKHCTDPFLSLSTRGESWNSLSAKWRIEQKVPQRTLVSAPLNKSLGCSLDKLQNMRVKRIYLPKCWRFTTCLHTLTEEGWTTETAVGCPWTEHHCSPQVWACETRCHSHIICSNGEFSKSLQMFSSQHRCERPNLNLW